MRAARLVVVLLAPCGGAHACHAAPATGAGDGGSASIQAPATDGSEAITFGQTPAPVDEAGATAEAGTPSAPSVLLQWRETGRRSTRDAHGNDHWSVELELVVKGGTPPVVRLGRRQAYGFTPMPPEGDDIAYAQSYIDAHGEYATVKRSGAGQLRVEAHGQDEAFPDHVPPTTNARTAIVRIPADAGVGVAETVEEPDAG